MADPLLIAKTHPAEGSTLASIDLSILPKMANRHGLITGATGTGKTVTLQTIAEQFSNIGVPVFMADVKGDLSGMAMAGSPTAKAHENLARRAAELALTDWAYTDNPVVFWDLFGEQGHPVRTTVSEMGPLLLARLLGLNDTQEGVLSIAFKVADDQGLLLLDLKDLRQMLVYCSDNSQALATSYGNVSAQSIGAIQRQLLQLDSQGGDRFFGEPALLMSDMIKVGEDGRGQVNILAADKLMSSPKLYATFLLWMLSELFEELPEVGDPEKPKLVFFFDEAHLLFDEAPRALLEKVEQVVRLIRSKGVGVYFITQNPIDVPEAIAGQLGNRVQHALRAFTPRDQKAVKSAAETMRANPAIGDMATAITELAVGEALISFLDPKGRPSVTERVFVLPPGSQIGPITPEQRRALIAHSLVAGAYEKTVDRESAYEKIKGRAVASADNAAPGANPGGLTMGTPIAGGTAPATAPAPAGGGMFDRVKDVMFGSTGPRGGRHAGLAEKAASSAVRSIGSAVGREIIRGVLGSLLGGSRRR